MWICDFLSLSIAATIFAYGQTSSGKTFTMRGVTESVVKDIYEHIRKVSDQMDVFWFWFCYEVICSFSILMDLLKSM